MVLPLHEVENMKAVFVAVQFNVLCVCYFAGKKKRLTFIECNNDINSMIDLAKVADLVSVGSKITVYFI